MIRNKIKIVLAKIIVFIGKPINAIHKQVEKCNILYLDNYESSQCAKCGKNFFISKPIFFIGEKFMQFGDNFNSRPGLRIECISEFEGQSFTPQLIIGNNVSCNFYCHIGCINKIVIGNDVTLGSHVLIEDHSHGTPNDIDTPVMKRPLHSKGPIIIEDNVWIGENACILANVIIGKGSIIGANAVVTHNIPPYSIAAGVPAKVIKTLK